MKKATFFIVTAVVSVALSLLWNGTGFTVLLSLTGGTVLWKLISRCTAKQNQTSLERHIAMGFAWLLSVAASFLLIFLLISWLGEAGIAIVCALLFSTVIVFLK